MIPHYTGPWMDDGINSQYIDEWKHNTVSSIFRGEISGGIWSLTEAVSLFSGTASSPSTESPDSRKQAGAKKAQHGTP